MEGEGDLIKLYARVCRDSGFGLSAINAATVTAKAIGRHPLEVWIALGMDRMERIAKGEVRP